MRRVRCAIYTRKSSEDGLEQEFNSLDAQREACAAYVTSQKAEGWVELAEAYDDGGLLGGTLERPALQRLLGAFQMVWTDRHPYRQTAAKKTPRTLKPTPRSKM